MGDDGGEFQCLEVVKMQEAETTSPTSLGSRFGEVVTIV
jgi:hypothetical protein